MLLLYSCPRTPPPIICLKSTSVSCGKERQELGSKKLMQAPRRAEELYPLVWQFQGARVFLYSWRGKKMSQMLTVGVGYINIRTNLRYWDRLLQLDWIVYLTKMTMSRLVMKTLINVFLNLLLLIQAAVRRDIDGGENPTLTFFLFFPFLGEF